MADGIIKIPTAPKLPSKELQEKLEKMPWCHRMYVPISFGEQKTLPGVGQTVEMKTNISFIKCMAEQCALWVKSKSKCGDLVNAESNSELADLKRIEAGTPTMLDVTGG